VNTALSKAGASRAKSLDAISNVNEIANESYERP
jgi:hypothetical protein